VPEGIEDTDTFVSEHAPRDSEVTVPISDLLDHVRLALAGEGLSDHADRIIDTVVDAVTNNCS